MMGGGSGIGIDCLDGELKLKFLPRFQMVRVRVEHDKFFMAAIIGSHSAVAPLDVKPTAIRTNKDRPARKLYDIVIYKHEFPNSPIPQFPLKPKSRVKQRHHCSIPHVQRRNRRLSFRTSIQRVLTCTTPIHEVVTNEIGDYIRVQGTLLAAEKTVAVGWQERELRCGPPVKATTKFDSGVCAFSEVKAELTNGVPCCRSASAWGWVSGASSGMYKVQGLLPVAAAWLPAAPAPAPAAPLTPFPAEAAAPPATAALNASAAACPVSAAAAVAPFLQAVTLAAGALHLLSSCWQMKPVMTPIFRADPWLKLLGSVGPNEASAVMSVNIHLSLSWEYSTFSSVQSDSKGNGSIGTGSEVNGSAFNVPPRHWGSRYDGSGGDE